jgi:hypothetical protein
MLKYLEKGHDVLSGFLHGVLQGLEQSEQPSDALGLMERWVERGLHLASIAHHLRLTPGAPSDLMLKIGRKAIDAKDVNATMQIIAAVIANNAIDLVDPIVVPGVRQFTAAVDTRWVRAIWFMRELQEFLSQLSEAQCEVVLENLTLCNRIDYNEERILQAIANKFPRSVWRFFKVRLDRDRRDGSGERYEGIPYDLRELRKPLSLDATFAVDTVRSWHSSDKTLFQFRGGRLLHNVFPGFSPEIEIKLKAVVEEGADDAIDFVLQLLRTYKGETFLHEVCKAIADSIPTDDKRLSEIELILQSTGVVTGPYGFVEAYQRKKQEVEPWLDDSRPKVRTFAERYQRSLDRAIASEQRRSEADYELRRREWPDNSE